MSNTHRGPFVRRRSSRRFERRFPNWTWNTTSQMWTRTSEISGCYVSRVALFKIRCRGFLDRWVVSTLAPHSRSRHDGSIFLLAFGNQVLRGECSFRKFLHTVGRQEILIFFDQLCDTRVLVGASRQSGHSLYDMFLGRATDPILTMR